MVFTKTFSDESTPEIAIVGGGLSFAPNYNQSRKYAPQAEILDYLQSTARTYNIYDRTQFNTKIKRMQWKDDRKKWALEWVNVLTEVEGMYEADVVVHGTGLFNIPLVPQEFKAFQGKKWHAARWRHEVDLTNKRVGVVGVNASAIQIIPKVADSNVKALHVYGRSPGYVTPQFDDAYSDIWNTFLIYLSLAWYSVLHRGIIYLTAWWQRQRQIRDPVLREKLKPARVLGSRRTVLSNNYYPTLTRDNVEYHREGIVEVTGNRITTADGETRELDVLILATGFDIPSNFPPSYWTGRGGIDITETWTPVARTYFGTCTPRAPNFFLVWGPMSGSFHQSVTSVVEAQVMFMIKTLSTMMENDYASMEITEKATNAISAAQIPPPPAASVIFFAQKKGTPPKKAAKVSFWCGSLAEFRSRLSYFSPQLSTVTRHESQK
ncbi:hypothetical protein BGX29_000632 [Mortierella sp. GBA35]|nr:hypothetical protein BGX29_000632 [Mortierella sp. GBA35]